MKQFGILLTRCLVVLLSCSCLVGLAGCAGSSGGGSGGSSSGIRSIYVVQQNNSPAIPNVLEFPATSNGSASPSASLQPPANFYISAMTVDTSGNIYIGGVATGDVPTVLVYAPGSTGSATPSRTILPTTYQGGYPTALVVDSSGLLYVLSGQVKFYTNIAVYSATATGSATPLRNIYGANTNFSQTSGSQTAYFAVDGAGNIYVSNSVTFSGAINIFSSTATGNVAPTKTITMAGSPEGIVVDGSGNIYTGVITTNPSTFAQSTSIVEYASGSTGAATPTKTIAGSSTGMSLANGLAMDSAGTLYMVNQIGDSGTVSYSLLGFSSSASGNVAPTVSFTSSSWTTALNQVAVH